jgi:hypothetical protein
VALAADARRMPASLLGTGPMGLRLGKKPAPVVQARAREAEAVGS